MKPRLMHTLADLTLVQIVESYTEKKKRAAFLSADEQARLDAYEQELRRRQRARRKMEVPQ